ncbi:PIG-L deacetylase family protein [Acidobacteriota bacterium]
MDEFLGKQRLLILAPHADDETYGCAGTIAKTKNLGGEVYVVICSVGDLTHYDGSNTLVSGQQRLQEFEKVMKYLKVDDWDVLFQDADTHLRLDAIPRRDLIALIEREGKLAIDKVRPTMIMLPAVSYNQDHEAVFRAGFTACRPHVPDYKSFQKFILAYDNTSLSWSMEREKFHPHFYVDISDFLHVKLNALSMHASQLRPSVHHGSVESVEFWAKARGREISVDAAEGFMCMRFVL